MTAETAKLLILQEALLALDFARKLSFAHPRD